MLNNRKPRHFQKYFKTRKALIILLSIISFNSYAYQKEVLHTISNWQIYNGGILLKAFNSFSTETEILLTTGQIRATDTIEINYFDDTPCFECEPRLTIRTSQNKDIHKIKSKFVNSRFKIRTTDLQILAFNNKSSFFKFYFKEEEISKEILLFTIKIK